MTSTERETDLSMTRAVQQSLGCALFGFL
uniref:Uncharacterized protein n=1 Tax=Anguilla anguilla TaxID=7936 RepID=A0A0E9Q3Q3_ANGAN